VESRGEITACQANLPVLPALNQVIQDLDLRMSDQDSGDKTEKATPKRLKDARQKGDVAKSKDVTNSALLLVSLLMMWQLGGMLVTRLSRLMDEVVLVSKQPFSYLLQSYSSECIDILLLATALIFTPLVVLGLCTDFLQAGPILTLEKIKPKMSNMNPVQGIKRIFSMDSLFELVKSILKTAIVLGVGFYIFLTLLNDILLLPMDRPESFSALIHSSTARLFGWILGIFSIVAVLDLSYQRFSHAKKMKMSMRDIKQEFKDSEGDPQFKGYRRQVAQEQAQESAEKAVSNSNVLLVNPIHVAVAIKYDKETCPIPTVVHSGEEEMALKMRAAAEAHKIPVLRNEKLARELLHKTEIGDAVPRELFDIIAQIIIWADGTSKRLHETGAQKPSDNTVEIPGEDLSRYEEF